MGYGIENEKNTKMSYLLNSLKATAQLLVFIYRWDHFLVAFTL